ncbi:unnamed protein product [Cuscuta campestris]|uniref:Glycosyltransferase subfamily 4-like N-terminal domain-containing protein n=1 Tax=Cuscuta campestris TaxID=132261 RepID=A0A484KEX7_9ASTE|nr:unnamed protein product [Cuscuta campestris]
MALNNAKAKKPLLSSALSTTLFFIVLFTIPTLFLLHSPTISICTTPTSSSHEPKPWSGDLRDTEFSWNHFKFSDKTPPTKALRVAVFSRKWPITTAPGGMERHAHTLHTALARRGHCVHVFTSPPMSKQVTTTWRGEHASAPVIHWHQGEPGRWRYNQAWEEFQEENKKEAFDVVHTESVALPHHLARNVSNLVVSWHGIALESAHSLIYQDLTRNPNTPMSPSFNKSLQEIIPKVLNEIRFFKSYAQHVAISDNCGVLLRDVYQIPKKRVHVIVNGVNEDDFREDPTLGREFRSKIGVPSDCHSCLVFGVAGRLVKDKGHPLLHKAFSLLIQNHRHVYLVVVGSGPWQERYIGSSSRVIVLGSMGAPEMKAFYNGIDVLVNPTLRPQGLDLTLMEAMMSGKPVLASRFPSIKGTIVVKDEFGLLFSPNVESLAAALEEVVAEGRRGLARRGKACKEYAGSMFTATKMALAYEKLFLCVNNETFCAYP